MDRKTGRLLTLLSAAAIFVGLALFIFLAAVSVMSSDDWFYGSFFKDGFIAYLAAMKKHYLTFNGRVLVHVVAEIVISAGKWLFTPVCAALMALSPIFAAKAAGLRRETPLCMGIFLLLLLAAPYPVLSQGVYWMSAFFNYVLPSAMLCGALYLIMTLRGGSAGRGRVILAAAASLLCGATTEQCGAVMVCLAAYFLLRSLCRRDGLARARLLSLAAAAAGYVTIFLSPATRGRAGAELYFDLMRILADVYRSLLNAVEVVRHSGFFALALSALFIMTGILARRRLGRVWPLLSAAAASILTVGLYIPAAALIVFIVLFCLACLDALALLRLGEEAAGLLVLMGFASLAVVLPTDSVAGRTMLPLCLMLTAGVAVLAAKQAASRAPRLGAVGISALLIFTLLTLAPTVRGFIGNYRLDLINAAAAETGLETGTIDFCVDYDYRYTDRKPDCSPELEAQYLRWLDADPDKVKVRYVGLIYPEIYVDGERAPYPARGSVDGRTYLPVRTVVEAAGGEIISSGSYNGIDIVLPWGVYNVDFLSTYIPAAVFRWTDGEGVAREVRVPKLFESSRNFFLPEVYSDILGFEVEFDGEDYHITSRGAARP